MANHILCEVFDYEFLDMHGNFLFAISTVKSNTIEYTNGGSNNLIIKDAIVNARLFKDIMYGKYRNMKIKVLGGCIVRAIEGGNNGTLEMVIKNATIESYNIDGEAGEIYGSTMVLSFTNTDREFNRNFSLDLQMIEDFDTATNRLSKDDNGDFVFFE